MCGNPCNPCISTDSHRLRDSHLHLAAALPAQVQVSPLAYAQGRKGRITVRSARSPACYNPASAELTLGRLHGEVA